MVNRTREILTFRAKIFRRYNAELPAGVTASRQIKWHLQQISSDGVGLWFAPYGPSPWRSGQASLTNSTGLQTKRRLLSVLSSTVTK